MPVRPTAEELAQYLEADPVFYESAPGLSCMPARSKLPVGHVKELLGLVVLKAARPRKGAQLPQYPQVCVWLWLLMAGGPPPSCACVTGQH